jgi:hypothetical protein
MSKNKSKEFIELQESYSKLQSKVQSKNNEIDMLINKITSLENKYILFYQESIRLPLISIEFWQKFKKVNSRPATLQDKSSSTKTTRGGFTFWGLKSIDYELRIKRLIRTSRKWDLSMQIASMLRRRKKPLTYGLFWWQSRSSLLGGG